MIKSSYILLILSIFLSGCNLSKNLNHIFPEVIILFISLIITNVLILVIYRYVFQKKEKELINIKKEYANLSEKNIELTQQIKLLQDKHINNFQKYNKLIKSKERDIQSLTTDMEIRRFKSKPIYELLIQIENNKSGKLNKSNLDELREEINLSFTEYIRQIKQEYSLIKDEDILILCLSRLNFSSSTIGKIHNLSGSAIRQRLSRLKQKKLSSGSC